jgi:hypothetical protein
MLSNVLRAKREISFVMTRSNKSPAAFTANNSGTPVLNPARLVLYRNKTKGLLGVKAGYVPFGVIA